MTESTTSTLVVAKALKRSQKVDEESNKDSISDLWFRDCKSSDAIVSWKKANIWQSVYPFGTVLQHFYILFYPWKGPDRTGWSAYSKWNSLYRKSISKVIPKSDVKDVKDIKYLTNYLEQQWNFMSRSL